MPFNRDGSWCGPAGSEIAHWKSVALAWKKKAEELEAELAPVRRLRAEVADMLKRCPSNVYKRGTGIK